MGLDMYACITRTPIGDVDFAVPEDAQEIAYWRKHPNLHGWMARRYFEKGGSDSRFNCNTVRLDAADLDDLERSVKENALPDTTGFFYGQSGPDRVPDDLAFIAKAREAIKAGCFVYYDSWW